MNKHFYIVIVAFLVALIGVSVKLIGTSIAPQTLAFYRMLLGFLVVLFIVPFIDKTAFKITLKEAKEYFKRKVNS